MSTRNIATLVGFQTLRDARLSLLNSNLIDGPKSFLEVQQLWKSAHEQSQKPPKHLNSGLPLLKELPPSFQTFERELKSRPTYQRHYASTGMDFQLVLAAVCHIITPQWYADLGYIEQLKQEAPEPGDLEGALAFLFNEEKNVPVPSINSNMTPAGAQHVITYPPSSALLAVTIPRLEPTDPAERGVYLPVSAKGNYPQILQINDSLVLANGVHHLSALLEVGWEYVPTLLRPAQSIYDCGLSPVDFGIFHEPQLMDRPPFLYDLFDVSVAPRFQQIVMDNTIQIIVQVVNQNTPRQGISN
jgi:hypothetical protein